MSSAMSASFLAGENPDFSHPFHGIHRSLRMLLEGKDTEVDDTELAAAEKLMKNPLMNFSQTDPQTAPTLKAASSAETQKDRSSTQTESEKERRAYRVDLIPETDGEYSFEEARARLPRYQVNTPVISPPFSFLDSNNSFLPHQQVPLGAVSYEADPVAPLTDKLDDLCWFGYEKDRSFKPPMAALAAVRHERDDSKENHLGETYSGSLPTSRSRSLDLGVLQEIPELMAEEVARNLEDDFDEAEDSNQQPRPGHILELSFEVFEDPDEEQLAEPGYQSPLLGISESRSVDGELHRVLSVSKLNEVLMRLPEVSKE